LWFIAIRSDLASSNLFYYLQVVGTVPCYLVFPGVVVERFIDQVGTDDVLIVYALLLDFKTTSLSTMEHLDHYFLFLKSLLLPLKN